MHTSESPSYPLMGRRVFLQAGTIGAYCDLEGIDFAAHLADVERVQAIIRRGVDQ